LTKFKPGDVVRYGTPNGKTQTGYAVLGCIGIGKLGDTYADFDAHTFRGEWYPAGSWVVSDLYALPEDEHDRVWGEYAAWKLIGTGK
jgi:hypothetical protein